MLIGLVVKHYERLFLGCASNSNGLLVLVEGDFADDLVKTNGGLFIFLTFIRLWLWLYIALRILFVEMLFGVFLWLSPHLSHVYGVKALEIRHFLEPWHLHVPRTRAYTIVHVIVCLNLWQVLWALLFWTVLINLVACPCPVQSWNLFLQKSLDIAVLLSMSFLVHVSMLYSLLWKQNVNYVLIFFLWWIILAFVVTFVVLDHSLVFM